jgi:hypothetical protein
MNKTMLAVVGAVGSALALVALVAASHFTKPEKLDALGCSVDIPGKTVIVLDTSDVVAEQTRSEIVDRVHTAIRDNVRDGELVSVFTVSELSKKNLTPVFAYCKPRREGNELKESTRLLQHNYVTKFEKPLEAAIAAPIEGSKQSPIAQSLIDLSLSDYVRSNGKTNLLVFSDMMEYTEKFSLYRCSNGQQAVRLFKDARGAAVARPTFHNVDVQLNIIPRADTSAAVGRCRDHFWAWFFGDDDGPGARLTPTNLPG